MASTENEKRDLSRRRFLILTAFSTILTGCHELGMCSTNTAPSETSSADNLKPDTAGAVKRSSGLLSVNTRQQTVHYKVSLEPGFFRRNADFSETQVQSDVRVQLEINYVKGRNRLQLSEAIGQTGADQPNQAGIMFPNLPASAVNRIKTVALEWQGWVLKKLLLDDKDLLRSRPLHPIKTWLS